MRFPRTVLLVVAAMLASLIPIAANAAPSQPGSRDGYSIEVMSSPPAYVSAGDARMRISLPPGQVGKVRITVEGRDVTDAFTPIDQRTLEGVVDGLAVGDNTVRVHLGNARAAARASLTLTNHPVTGPMFSGPHQEPFLCATARHRNNAGLGEILDDDCSMERVVSFTYRTTGGAWADYTPGSTPDDMATTTTIDGQTVDYIVRWERGTINRFIYSIAVLSPEAQEVDTPDLSAWNDRLIYSFQGGVAIGRYQGNPSQSAMLLDNGLRAGYAVAYSTGNATSTHYNLELGGETAIMVKDRFVTAYGVPDYTVGIGGSGGAIQQYVYGQNHPGLIDAAIPIQSYPDMISQVIHIGDCELLERWIDEQILTGGDPKWRDWENRSLLEGLNAINGFPNSFRAVMPTAPLYPAGSSECIEGWRGLSPLVLNPSYGTAPGATPAQQADTEWTHFADAIDIYGVNPEDEYANRVWDNVGVQYGLESLVDGSITVAEFLDVNANAGSWKNEPDMVQERCPYISQLCPSPAQLGGLTPLQIYPSLIDPWSWNNMALSTDGGQTPAPRVEADPDAIEAAYERGLVFRGDMAIPTVDWRQYLEHRLDMHNSVQSFVTRQRMTDFAGHADNQLVWFTQGAPSGSSFDQTPMVLELIDRWMANIEAQPNRTVARNKPSDAMDACFDVNGELIYRGADAWNGILDDGPDGPCTEEFPVYSTSRIVAGGPMTGDVFKCHVQSMDAATARGVYGDVTFSDDELARLAQIFPTGVCDYIKGDARRPATL
ncbi:MAG: DUF6351 family protein [Dermatophilaceae bacterium]|nr:DUF6351 family protein [Intrasporangiaceae bacterium]